MDRHSQAIRADALKNEAPRSSLLRRSSHFGYEGLKLRGILRNSPTRRPEPLGGVPKPLPSFAKATEGSLRLAYSAEAAASAAKAGHPRNELRGIRRRRIMLVWSRQQSDSKKARIDHVKNMLLQFIPERRKTLIVKIALDRTR
jgi:hypothetical protein